MKFAQMLPAIFVVVSTSFPLHAAIAGDAVAGQAVFKAKCGLCHSVLPGKNVIGPSLDGVVGRKAGSVPDYHYSDANKASGLTWDAATLDRYITSPHDVVPGTKMTYGGLKDDAQRGDLIAYLGTLH